MKIKTIIESNENYRAVIKYNMESGNTISKKYIELGSKHPVKIAGGGRSDELNFDSVYFGIKFNGNKPITKIAGSVLAIFPDSSAYIIRGIPTSQNSSEDEFANDALKYIQNILGWGTPDRLETGCSDEPKIIWEKSE